MSIPPSAVESTNRLLRTESFTVEWSEKALQSPAHCETIVSMQSHCCC
eukprot:COSAG02_NODE_4454_length_5342_cov_2.052642_2_plen_48_part_00